MPAVTRPWTRAEVLELIEANPLATPRYELVDGVLLVSPSPGSVHQSAVGELYYLLTLYCKSEPGVGEAFVSPSDIEPERGQVVQPDVFVVPTDEAKRIRRERPVQRLLLAAEVLSPHDPSGDRTRKRDVYQRTVPDYWIVDTEARCIEFWRPGIAASVHYRERVEWQPLGVRRPFVLDVLEYFAIVYGET